MASAPSVTAPAAASMLRSGRAPLSAAIGTAFLLLAVFVSIRQAALFLVGVGLGVALAGCRFGFTTGWRQLVTERDPRGLTGQLVLLAMAAAFAMPLLGGFSELQAALGPPSVALLLGAFLFGMTMQIADGCGSGTLYKAGMGVPLNLALLPLFALGSFLGSLHLEHWLSLGASEPVGMVDRLGAGPAAHQRLRLLLHHLHRNLLDLHQQKSKVTNMELSLLKNKKHHLLNQQQVQMSQNRQHQR